MTVGIYLDENVHGAIAAGLRHRKVDVLTVYEDGRCGDADERVLERAAELVRVVFTQDQDFATITAALQSEGAPFAGVFYVKKNKLTVRECIEDLQLIAHCTTYGDWISTLTNLPL